MVCNSVMKYPKSTLKEKNYSYSFLLNLLSICIDETYKSVHHTVLGYFLESNHRTTLIPRKHVNEITNGH